MSADDGPPRIFVSYAQQSERHSEAVLALAQALNDDGLSVELDRYHQHELIDWPRWCEGQLKPEQSDFVLMICSAEYCRRIDNQVAWDVGRGVFWEGRLIYNAIYLAKANTRFIPVLLGDESDDAVPDVMQGWTRFRLHAFGSATADPGYLDLLRLLTRQPAIPRPIPGPPTLLPPIAVRPRPDRAPDWHQSPKPQNLPYSSLDTLFKGRDALLAEIRAGFVSGRGAAQAIGTRHAVHGLGGIGKTRLAVEYAWRHAEDYSALLFVTAAPTAEPIGSLAGEPATEAAAARALEQLQAQVAGLAPVLGVAADVTESAAHAAAVLRWLADPAHSGWLLILDNLDDEATATAADRLCANLTQGHLLLTGRLANWPGQVHALPLDVLDPDPARDFLLERTAGRRRPRPDDADQAQTLAAELDGLALALEQAAAFICRERSGLADYLVRWRRADARVRQWHDARLMNYPRPLATTWQTSADILSEPARALLDLIAWLGPEPLPRFLFDHGAAPQGLEALFVGRASPAEVMAALLAADAAQGPALDPAESLAQLADLSLLQPTAADFDSPGRLHRVTALMIRAHQSADQQAAALAAALDLVNAAAVGDSIDVRLWPVWGLVAPHLTALLAHTEGRANIGHEVRLLNDLGGFLCAKARHAEAEPLLRRALFIDEQAYGSDHPTVAIRLNNLAQLLKDTNRLTEAEPLMRRALIMTEQGLGSDHPRVAIRLNNLAALLLSTDRFAEAEPLMRRALAIDEQTYGAYHPAVAGDLNNLAQLLQATCRLPEAEPLMSRALVINEQRFGSEHPNVANALNNLAILLQATNRLAEAEPLMRRALAIHEQGYGPDHPDVAIDLNNLAQFLQATNRFSEAEPLMWRALAVFEQSYGPDHTKVANSLSNLATLLQDTNRLAEAERLMRRALAIDEDSYGLDHPNVARDLNNLAPLLTTTNRLAEAEQLMRRALASLLRFTAATGHRHPNLDLLHRNYAGLLTVSGLTAVDIAVRLAEVCAEAGVDPAVLSDGGGGPAGGGGNGA
jgi:tetratricopeptide (TPR) repeat protein